MVTVSDERAREDAERPEAEGSADLRVTAAFRAWLEALATDPDAATAASIAYESLGPEGRDAWLDAIAAEAPLLDVPALALYAPLLGVEGDGARRTRIEAALAEAPLLPPTPRKLRALHGVHASGDEVAAIVIPLYLDFVELLVCRYQPDVGVVSARRGPLLRASEVWSGASAVREIDGAALSEHPVAIVVEGLAHALVADRRHGRPPPEPLRTYDFLFTLDLGDPTGVSAAAAAHAP